MVLLAALAGLIGGMAVNYLADILPGRGRLSGPVCGSCGGNFPLGNYFVWPRRCPHCGRGRGLRVWLTEAAGVGLALGVFFAPEMRQILGVWPGVVLLVYLGVVVVIDLEHRLILHRVSAAGAVIAAGIGLSLHGWAETLVGGLAGFTLMYLFYVLGILFNRLVGRLRGEEVDEIALGFGDVIFNTVLGLLLGWPNILLGLALAVFMGGLFSLGFMGVQRLRGRFRALTAIPYGPFLALGAFLLLYLPSAAQRVLALLFPVFFR